MRLEFIGPPGSGKTSIGDELVKSSRTFTSRREATGDALAAFMPRHAKAGVQLGCRLAARSKGGLQAIVDALAEPAARSALQRLLTCDKSLQRWYGYSMRALSNSIGSNNRNGHAARHANITRHLLYVTGWAALISEFQMRAAFDSPVYQRVVVLDEGPVHNTPIDEDHNALDAYIRSSLGQGLSVVHVDTPATTVAKRLKERYAGSVKTWPAIPHSNEVLHEAHLNRLRAVVKLKLLASAGIPIVSVDGSRPVSDAAKTVSEFLRRETEAKR